MENCPVIDEENPSQSISNEKLNGNNDKEALGTMGHQELMTESVKIHQEYEEKLNKQRREFDDMKQKLELLSAELKVVKNQRTRDPTEEELNPIFESYVRKSMNSRNTNVIQKMIQKFEKQYKQKEELERDFFTMMMLQDPVSWVWIIGLISVASQLTLGILLIHEQMNEDKFCLPTMTIPIRSGLHICVAQFIAIILSIMTQTDLVMGIRNISLLWYKDKKRWKAVIKLDSSKRNEMITWITRIFIPCMLKMIVGLIVLVATFFIIIQSDSVVELLQDFAALLIISTIDDIFFMMADNGYFGGILSNTATEAKGIKIKKNNTTARRQMKTLAIVIMVFLLAWMHIIIGQHKGKYMKQAYPLCPLNDELNGTTIKDFIGNGRCDFPKGSGANIEVCGWEADDCIGFNMKYPNCNVPHPMKLGDGKCDYGVYNTIECGFDHGDCAIENLDCGLDGLSKVHYGICVLIESNDCGNGKSDCSNETQLILRKEFRRYGGNRNPSANNIPLNFPDDYWAALVPGPDEFLYGIPKNADRILEINTNSKSTTLVGDNLSSDRRKWSSGVRINNTIYGIPWQSNSILRFDIESKKLNLIAEGHEILMKGSFHGVVVAPNGMIYMFPGMTPETKFSNIVKFDPFNETHPLVELGYKLDKFYLDGILGGDGNIYAFPHGIPGKVLKINVADDSVSFIGNDSYDVSHKGACARDGNIYSLYEYDGRTQIIEINVTDQSISNVDVKKINLFRKFSKWEGFVEGFDGNLYAIPCLGEAILIFDPINKNSKEIRLSEIKDFNKTGWTGSVRATNGFIYALPKNEFGSILEVG